MTIEEALQQIRTLAPQLNTTLRAVDEAFTATERFLAGHGIAGTVIMEDGRWLSANSNGKLSVRDTTGANPWQNCNRETRLIAVQAIPALIQEIRRQAEELVPYMESCQDSIAEIKQALSGETQ